MVNFNISALVSLWIRANQGAHSVKNLLTNLTSQYPYLPQRRAQEIPSGAGAVKRKIFKEKYEKIGISTGVKGSNLKTFSGKGMDIF